MSFNSVDAMGKCSASLRQWQLHCVSASYFDRSLQNINKREPPLPTTFFLTKTLGVIIDLLIDFHLTHTLTNKSVGEPDFRPGLSIRTLGIKNSVAYVFDRI